MNGFPALVSSAGFVAGLIVGALYFALLYRAVRLQSAAAPTGALIRLHLLRALLAVAGFWGLAQLGAWPLLAGLAGFLIARAAAKRRVAGV